MTLRRAIRMMGLGAAAVALLIVAGNVAIIIASASARRSDAPLAPSGVEGIRNLAVVDEKLWRGSAPSSRGYRDLAAHGVTTVVDLRAEEWVQVDEGELARLGLVRHTIPIRDGQVPTPEQVDRFLSLVASSSGRVFVHCGAGVGRAGAMAGAYLVETGRATAAQALRRNLAIGTPSLEQIAWVKGLEPDDLEAPGPLVIAMSRLLDGPRRVWHLVGF